MKKMFTQKNKKSGFSLIECVVAFAILAVLIGFVVPSFVSSSAESKYKADLSRINNIQATLNSALQNNAIYNDAFSIADASNSNITIEYIVSSENILEMGDLSIVTSNNITITSEDTDTELGKNLSELKQEVKDFVNGKIEPVELNSERTRNATHTFIADFPDIQYKVNVEYIMQENGE